MSRLKLETTVICSYYGDYASARLEPLLNKCGIITYGDLFSFDREKFKKVSGVGVKMLKEFDDMRSYYKLVKADDSLQAILTELYSLRFEVEMIKKFK